MLTCNIELCEEPPGYYQAGCAYTLIKERMGLS